MAQKRDDQEEAVVLVELGDFRLEAEVLDDLAGLEREAPDVVGQGGGGTVRLALEFLEVEPAGVLEGEAGRAIEDRLDVGDFACGTSKDCQPVGIPDECDIATGTSGDDAGDGIPDECDVIIPTDSEPSEA